MKPYFLDVSTIPDWMSKFAFIAENREQVGDKKKFSALVESIISKRRILCAIEVIKFDRSNKEHFLPTGDHGLLDLNYNNLDNIDNVEYLVVDGQHRILALREIDNDKFNGVSLKDITVKICVDPNTTRADIYDMNNTGTPWKTIDYIKSFAESGIGDYPTLYRKILKREGEGFRVGNGNDLAYYYSAGYGSEVLKEIRTQTYKFNESKGDDAIEAAKWFRLVPGLEKKWCDQSFVRNILLIQRQYSTFSPNKLANYLIEKNVDILLPSEDQTTVGKVELKARMLKHWYASIDCKYFDKRFYDYEQKIVIADRDVNRNGDVVCAGKYCTVTGIENLAVDHLESWDEVNPNTIIDNAELLCIRCNSSKNNSDKSAVAKMYK